ncbi:MAG TPA: dihydropyrimidinase [Anaerolineae bacterium]
MASETLIRGGTLVLPQGEVRGDLLIAGGRIVRIGENLAADGATVVDATGCVVLPGLVDPHTHIQLDTGIYKTPDNWEIGTRTAACGGVTTVVDFATQFPGQNVEEALAARLAEIGELAQIDYGLHMMLTALPGDGELDRWLAWLARAGVSSIKLYTTYRPNYYQDDAALLRAFRAAAAHDLTVMLHCENDAIVGAATADFVGRSATELANHGRARPALAEVEAAHRALFLARVAGCRLYVVHCSVCGTVDQVTEARAAGDPAIAETTPQYLLLDEDLYAGDHPEWVIMQPPLRAPAEKDALWARLAGGEIMTVGTDHCDYTLAEKQRSPRFTETPGGIPGLETMLPLLATYGVAQGRLSWTRLVEVTAAAPARIFGLVGKGVLQTGADADVVVYDPAAARTIRAGALHGIAGYTPYDGWPVSGAVRTVFSRGRLVVDDGAFVPAPGWGRFQRGELAGAGTRTAAALPGQAQEIDGGLL